ncbi:MAG: class I SAM-dependent methyltransferase [Puia sp.]|nr:class I SAM-dependent methyltransferase [Puia sp.]
MCKWPVGASFPKLRTIIALQKTGIRVLDIGCGTGAITAGIAEWVGEHGHVTGIDSSDHLIAKGHAQYSSLHNLELIEADLFGYRPDQPFYLVVSARVLPWLPPPPRSMGRFQEAFLDWRADAGMDNEMADHLPGHFEKQGYHAIESIPADEAHRRGDPDFAEKAGIWSTVAETRGIQVLKSGYISEPGRLQAIEEYKGWIKGPAASMVHETEGPAGQVIGSGARAPAVFDFLLYV